MEQTEETGPGPVSIQSEKNELCNLAATSRSGPKEIMKLKKKAQGKLLGHVFPNCVMCS